MTVADVSMADAVADVPWSEKYRPRTLEEVAAHTDIIDTIKKLLADDQLPHMLFYGPPGTGKTSTVLALAKQMYGTSIDAMTLELNASDDRGINIVRNEIQDFASTRTMMSNKCKLIILDECDAMTKDAQMALRRVMEKYVKNARFCLICNYVSKIIPALQSRCTRFRFQPLPLDFVKTRLQYICKEEDIQGDEQGIRAVMTLGCGDMRRTLNLLQSTCMASGHVTEVSTYQCAGKPLPSDVEDIAHSLFNDSLQDSFRKISALQKEKGIALVDILYEIHPFIFKVSMPPKARIDLVSKLADAEYRLAFGTSDKLQLGSICGAFCEARQSIVSAAM
jgi:replication factor C subunit 3/5